MPEESAAVGSAKPEGAARAKSTIDFPYLDLDNAVEIAQKVRDVGGDQCEWNQLATKLAVSGDGGGFRMRMLTAKTFGLLTYERGNIRLTSLGIMATDPAQEKRARYEAFLYVGLYKQLFERLNGQPLPPPAAIERMVEGMGVAPKQKDKARVVFLRSAKQAGLFELASDRLSTPPGLNSGLREATPTPKKETEEDKHGGGDGGGSGGNDDGDTERFEIPIPGKKSVRVMVPRDLDADDWTMLQSMITVYINRWKGFKKTEAGSA